MKWIDSNFNPSGSYELTIYARLIAPKNQRILVAQKSSLTNILFNIANTLKYNPSDESISEVSVTIIVVCSFIGLTLLFFLAYKCFKSSNLK